MKGPRNGRDYEPREEVVLGYCNRIFRHAPPDCNSIIEPFCRAA